MNFYLVSNTLDEKYRLVKASSEDEAITLAKQSITEEIKAEYIESYNLSCHCFREIPINQKKYEEELLTRAQARLAKIEAMIEEVKQPKPKEGFWGKLLPTFIDEEKLDRYNESREECLHDINGHKWMIQNYNRTIEMYGYTPLTEVNVDEFQWSIVGVFDLDKTVQIVENLEIED
jgi:hypothetical protein